MAVTHELSVRQDLCNNVVDRLDGGVLRYLTAADATVADGSFGTPAFGAADGSAVATANAIGDATNSTGSSQTVAKAALRSASANIVFCSVTAIGGGGDIEITNTVVANTEVVRTDSLTYASAP